MAAQNDRFPKLQDPAGRSLAEKVDVAVSLAVTACLHDRDGEGAEHPLRFLAAHLRQLAEQEVAYAAWVRSTCSTIVDPLNGEHVAIDRTLLDLDAVKHALQDGSKPLLIQTSERSGKTTTARLISLQCLDGPDALVPCIVPAAELIRFVRDSPAVTDADLLDSYLRAMHAQQHPYLKLAAAERRLAILLDGAEQVRLHENKELASRLTAYVTTTLLAKAGRVIMLASGAPDEWDATCAKVELAPLDALADRMSAPLKQQLKADASLVPLELLLACLRRSSGSEPLSLGVLYQTAADAALATADPGTGVLLEKVALEALKNRTTELTEEVEVSSQSDGTKTKVRKDKGFVRDVVDKEEWDELKERAKQGHVGVMTGGDALRFFGRFRDQFAARALRRMLEHQKQKEVAQLLKGIVVLLEAGHAKQSEGGNQSSQHDASWALALQLLMESEGAASLGGALAAQILSTALPSTALGTRCVKLSEKEAASANVMAALATLFSSFDTDWELELTGVPIDWLQHALPSLHMKPRRLQRVALREAKGTGLEDLMRDLSHVPSAEELVLDFGDVATDEGVTPLIFTAQHNHANVARALAKGGADRRAVTRAGQTALQVAIAADHDEVAAVLGRFGGGGEGVQHSGGRVGALVIDAGTGELKLLAVLELPQVELHELAIIKISAAEAASKFSAGDDALFETLCKSLEEGLDKVSTMESCKGVAFKWAMIGCAICSA